MPDALIPPEVRARLPELRLGARRAVGDRGIGLHRSRSRGAGLEFAQYRAYEPGDEPRQIDWKLYARSDRFFVREAERESPLTVWLLVDASASMAQADRARPGYSRLDAARGIAACLADLALLQGDRFGLVAGRPEIRPVPGHDDQAMRQRRRRNQRIALRTRVGNVQPSATTRDGDIDRQHPLRKRRQHPLLQPSPQQRPLHRIAALDPQHAPFQLQHSDDRQEQARDRHARRPGHDMRIGLARRRPPQLGHHVGIE